MKNSEKVFITNTLCKIFRNPSEQGRNRTYNLMITSHVRDPFAPLFKVKQPNLIRIGNICYVT